MTDRVIAWARAGRREYLMSSFYSYAKHSDICPDINEEEYGDVCTYLEECLPNTPRIVEWRMRTGRLHSKPGRYCLQFNDFQMPRKTYKTSLIKALCCFAQELDPDIRIVLGRATSQMAEQTLEGGKDELERNPALLNAFGNIRARYSTWTTARITRADRTPGIKEPTIDTTGLGQSQTGQHPDLVILDDLVHEGNFESERDMYNAKKLVDSYDPILESWGSLIVVGTRWGDNDVHGYIMARDERLTDEGKAPKFRHFILEAYTKDGKVRFPTALPEAFLARQRDTCDPKMFAAWYLNRARAVGEDIFTLAYIQYFDGEFNPGPFPTLTLDDKDPLRARFGTNFPLWTVLTVDPAPTVGPKSDFTGMTLTGFDARDPVNWWVLWADEFKKLPSDRLDYTLYICRLYDPALIVLENADMETALLQQRLQALGLRGKVVRFDPRVDRKRITATDLTPRGRNAKAAQIESLEPVLRARRVFFARGDTAKLIARLQQYPYLIDNHDDVLDAFSMTQAYERRAQEETVGVAPANVRVYEDKARGLFTAYASVEGGKVRGFGKSATEARTSLMASLVLDKESRRQETLEFEREGISFDGGPVPDPAATIRPGAWAGR